VIVEAGRDNEAAQWLKARGVSIVPPYVTLVLMDGEKIRAVALFNNYQASNIDLSIVADGAEFQRKHVRALFTYPFKTLKVNRISVRTSADNIKVRKLIRRLGFEPEGKSLKFYGQSAAMNYGMLRENCKWL